MLFYRRVSTLFPALSIVRHFLVYSSRYSLRSGIDLASPPENPNDDKHPSNDEKDAWDKENKPIELACQHRLRRVCWIVPARVCFSHRILVYNRLLTGSMFLKFQPQKSSYANVIQSEDIYLCPSLLPSDEFVSKEGWNERIR